MSIISYKAIQKEDGKEYCPQCKKELDRDKDFPEYTDSTGWTSWGNVLQCSTCGYCTSILYD
jgi:hypothetical protein